MKKLMFAAAALTAGFAMAEIVSSDIVGYAQSGLQEGATMVAPQFLNIGTDEATPLQSIVPTGDLLSENVVIQTLTPYCYTASAYMWIDYAGDDGDQAAWVDPDTYEIVEGVSFEPGQGLWVQGSSASQSITFPAPEL